ncbi:hypothetical protein ACFPRL_31505 [Pseudoclavibacter helvolus]
MTVGDRLRADRLTTRDVVGDYDSEHLHASVRNHGAPPLPTSESPVGTPNLRLPILPRSAPRTSGTPSPSPTNRISLTRNHREELRVRSLRADPAARPRGLRSTAAVQSARTGRAAGTLRAAAAVRTASAVRAAGAIQSAATWAIPGHAAPSFWRTTADRGR